MMQVVGRVMGQARIALVLVFALLLVGLVAIRQPVSVAANVTIVAQDFSFIGPNGNGDVTIPVGTAVIWTNGGGTHTTTSDATPPLWDAPLGAGAQFTFTFTQVGSFPYHCTFHGSPGAGMHGTITVVSAPPPTPTGLHVTGATFNSVTFSWTNGDPTANVAVSDGTTVTNLSPGTASFTRPGVALGSYVCLNVAAWNGGGASAWSSFTCGVTVPLTPTGIQMTGATTSSISFAWNDPDTLSALAVVSGTTGGTVPHGFVPGTTTYTESGVAAGYWACIEVAAYNASYASAFSPWVCGLAVPNAPTAIHVTGHTSTSVSFGWTDSDPYSGIVVSNGTSTSNQAAGTVAYMQGGMTPGSYVCISLAAYNSSGASPWSAALTGWVCGQAT